MIGKETYPIELRQRLYTLNTELEYLYYGTPLKKITDEEDAVSLNALLLEIIDTAAAIGTKINGIDNPLPVSFYERVAELYDE